MKSLYVTFDDEEFEQISKDKKDLSWHDYIMSRLVISTASQSQVKETPSR